MSRHDKGEHLGRFRLGQVVPLLAWVRDSDDSAIAADAPPLARVFDQSGTLIDAFTLPALDRYGILGLYGLPLRLGFGLEPGHFIVTYACLVGGRAFIATSVFEIVRGGDASGAVISLFASDRPEASYVLAQVTSGRILQGRNPRTD
jgi:hypothetical protein